jgi:hypothetical protein
MFSGTSDLSGMYNTDMPENTASDGSEDSPMTLNWNGESEGLEERVLEAALQSPKILTTLERRLIPVINAAVATSLQERGEGSILNSPPTRRRVRPVSAVKYPMVTAGERRLQDCG